jgi:hypothetical protein
MIGVPFTESSTPWFLPDPLLIIALEKPVALEMFIPLMIS